MAATAPVASAPQCDNTTQAQAQAEAPAPHPIKTVANSITTAVVHFKDTLMEMKETRTQAMKDAANDFQGRAVNFMDAGLDHVLPTVALVSKTLALSEATCNVTHSLKSLDERFAMLQSVHSLSERLGLGATLLSALEYLQSVDKSVTHGSVQSTVMHAYETGLLAVNHVVQKFQQAQQCVTGNETPKEASPAAEVAAAPVPVEPVAEGTTEAPANATEI